MIQWQNKPCALFGPICRKILSTVCLLNTGTCIPANNAHNQSLPSGVMQLGKQIFIIHVRSHVNELRGTCAFK